MLASRIKVLRPWLPVFGGHINSGRNLKRLNLSGNQGICDAGAVALAQNLFQRRPQKNSLTDLNISNCCIGEEGAESLATRLNMNKWLECLDVSNNTRMGYTGHRSFYWALVESSAAVQVNLVGISGDGSQSMINRIQKKNKRSITLYNRALQPNGKWLSLLSQRGEWRMS